MTIPSIFDDPYFKSQFDLCATFIQRSRLKNFIQYAVSTPTPPAEFILTGPMPSLENNTYMGAYMALNFIGHPHHNGVVFIVSIFPFTPIRYALDIYNQNKNFDVPECFLLFADYEIPYEKQLKLYNTIQGCLMQNYRDLTFV